MRPSQFSNLFRAFFTFSTLTRVRPFSQPSLRYSPTTLRSMPTIPFLGSLFGSSSSSSNNMSYPDQRTPDEWRAVLGRKVPLSWPKGRKLKKEKEKSGRAWFPAIRWGCVQNSGLGCVLSRLVMIRGQTYRPNFQIWLVSAFSYGPRLIDSIASASSNPVYLIVQTLIQVRWSGH